MSCLTCPCGFRADGTFREANLAYRAHGCEHHVAELVEQPDTAHASWSGLLGFVAFLAFLSFICTHGWGLFR